MNINIEDYLSNEEIKEIVIEEIRKHVRNCVGEVSVSSDKSRVLIGVMAKTLAKEGVQELIPNFKELINLHIQEEISKIIDQYDCIILNEPHEHLYKRMNNFH